jgi:outer membrane biosynthesis protein TonB
MRGKTALTADNADFVDDVDYAAVSQSASPSAATTAKGGSDAIPGKSKGKGSMSLSGSMDSYQVVYVKENVSVYPTQHARERISGRLRLIKQDPSLFMVQGTLDHILTTF